MVTLLCTDPAEAKDFARARAHGQRPPGETSRALKRFATPDWRASTNNGRQSFGPSPHGDLAQMGGRMVDKHEHHHVR